MLIYVHEPAELGLTSRTASNILELDPMHIYSEVSTIRVNGAYSQVDVARFAALEPNPMLRSRPHYSP